MVIVNKRLGGSEAKPNDPEAMEIDEAGLLEELNKLEKDDKTLVIKKAPSNISMVVHDLNLALVPFEESKKHKKSFKAICHSWFIVKDKGMEINWKKPLVQKS
jgi:hypothetical protein